MDLLEFLTVKEFAKKIKITEAQVRRWIDSGRVKAIRINESKKSHWRIPYSELKRIHAKAYEEEYDDE